MKKPYFLFLLILLSGALGIRNAEAGIPNTLPDDKIFFFYSSGCPHCHEAIRYINENHKTLDMEMVNIERPDGYRLFIAGCRKFGLTGNVGTPLLCIGKNHIMGWTNEFEPDFDLYVQAFLNEQKKK